MSDIVIIEKPDNISYGIIRNVLHEAHEENFKKGIILGTMTLTAEEMEAEVKNNNGKTFVAMDGDKIVGTTSCWAADFNTWYVRGKVMKWMLLGVIPSYKGRHISSLLYEAVENEAKGAGIPVIYFDTASENKAMHKSAEHLGFQKVRFFAPKTAHYSIVFVKWLDSCPFSSFYCKMKYQVSRIKTICRYKPGRVKRFI